MKLLPGLRFPLLASVLVAALVAACGGGGDSDDSVVVSPASPSASASPGASASATSTGTPAPVPTRPADPFEGAEAVSEYLRGSDTDLAGCLPDLVREWRLASIPGQRCFLVDLDGDSRDEYIFIVTVPPTNTVQLPGDVWFFEDEEHERAPYQSARSMANTAIENVAVVGMQDLTGDNSPDVVILWETCGASTCATHVIVASHQIGAMQNLAPADLEIPGLESFEIDDNNRLLLRGGIVGSAGAGPQRGMTTQLSWGGFNFRVEEVPNEPEYLIHLVNDADEVLAGGQYDDARELFEAVVEDDELKDWKAEIGEQPGNDELRAYALFRSALAAQRSGSPGEARAYLDRAASEFSETLHGSGAAAYLAALDRGQSPNQACSTMETFLAQPPIASLISDYWDYGYENPERSVQTLCR